MEGQKAMTYEDYPSCKLGPLEWEYNGREFYKNLDDPGKCDVTEYFLGPTKHKDEAEAKIRAALVRLLSKGEFSTVSIKYDEMN